MRGRTVADMEAALRSEGLRSVAENLGNLRSVRSRNSQTSNATEHVAPVTSVTSLGKVSARASRKVKIEDLFGAAAVGTEASESAVDPLVRATANAFYAPLPTADDDDDEDNTDGEVLNMPSVRKDASFFDKWMVGYYTLIPEGNTFLDVWDLVLMFGLLFTAIILPFDVALFAEEPKLLSRMLTCMDSLFLLDIVLTFNVAYDVLSSGSNVDLYEKKPLKIARHYMAFPFSEGGKAGWFWWDTLTLMPWDQLGDAQDFVLVRMLRLTRMFRLVRFFKLFNKWQLHFGTTMSIINSARTLFLTLMACHWFACLWAHLAMSGERNWMQGWLDERHTGRSVEDCHPMEVYNLALYWCIATLTSVGYGDVVPQTQKEVTMLIVTMFSLGFLWAWVLAHMVQTLQSMDVFANETQQLMDDLNLLMSHRELDTTLRQRCRKHLFESFHVHRQRHQQRTVKWLSETLQGEIAVVSGVDRACRCVWYLSSMETPVLIAIAQRFIGDIFSPNEYVHIRYAVSVIRKGSCVKRHKILSKDDVIGEDMILATDHLVDHVSPKTLTFLEVMTLSRADLLDVCDSHPTFDKRMRRAQVRLALWRAFILEAHCRKRGKTSILDLNTSARNTALRSLAGKPAHLRFSESIASADAHRWGANQAILDGVMHRVDALQSWMEASHSQLAREVTQVSDRVEDMLEKAGLPRLHRSFLPRIRC